jgi:D-glycero-D-manno-heptose 1,7-bisphosphate phosphatase
VRVGIFFERDGVLSLPTVERGHQVTPLSLEDFRVNPAAQAPLMALKAAGFVLLATTNQPGLARGYLMRRELDRMHELLRRQLPLDDIFVCPHDETDDCTCRKPSPGLFTEAAYKWHLDLERSFVVSDKWPDAQAACLVGATSLLLKSPWVGKGHHDFVLSDLPGVAERILHLQASPVLLMDQA